VRERQRHTTTTHEVLVVVGVVAADADVGAAAVDGFPIEIDVGMYYAACSSSAPPCTIFLLRFFFVSTV